MSDQKLVSKPVANVLMARKELEDSAHPLCAREIMHTANGWTVTSTHPTLGMVDTWEHFTSEHEAQAFADGLTIHDDLEDHEMVLDLDISLAEELDIDGDVGSTSFIDPDTIRDYNMGVL